MDTIIRLYKPFFEASDWHAAVMTSAGLMTILTLAIMECLLSVDNAVVLAAQTQSLGDPKKERSALMWGLWGSYLFRFIAIGLGTFLMKFWLVKAVGAGYLLWMSLHFFYEQHMPKPSEEKEAVAKPKSFWGTVAAIVLLDFVFSIDSILTALAIDNNPVIVLIGGMIGILAMRFVAQMMIVLLAKIPELLYMAYVLIGFIAIKLALSLPMIDIEVSNTFFSIFVLVAFLATFGGHWYNERKKVRHH
jgi:YkoY family integral membrane protein